VEAHGFSRAKKIAELWKIPLGAGFRPCRDATAAEAGRLDASFGTAEAVPFHETLPREDA